jgi:peptide/nickel transport system substrate-binding protein
MRSKIIVSLLWFILMLPGVAAQENNTVTMALTLDPGTLDPHGAPHPSSPVLLAYVYDTLVFQDETGKLQPFLAESWTVEDGAITFMLRSGIVFSNGNPVNADAVIFTFERLKEIGRRSLIYSDIANVAAFEKVSDMEVRFVQSEPSVTLLSALSYPFAAILDPEATTSAGEDYGVNPVGSGPFMLKEWVPQNSMRFVPNPNYHNQRPTDNPDQQPQVEELLVRFTREDSTRVNALLTGEIDIAYISSAPQLARLADNPDFTIMDDPSRGMALLGFNSGRAPFDQAEARRAVAQAVDKQFMIEVAVPGMAQILNTPLPPTIFGYNPDLEATAPGYDVVAARQLIGTSSYDGREITILTSSFPTHDTMATILQAQLAEIGIPATINILDYAGMRAAAAAGEYDILLTRYNWNDPDVLRTYLATDSSSNRYFYSNPALDALVEQGRAEFDEAARFDIYTEAQQIVIDEMPWVPLFLPITRIVVSNRLQNVNVLHSHVIFDDVVIAG